MAWQFDPPTWVTQAASLIGAGGLGAVLLRLIDKWFGRAKEQDSNRTVIRGELREQIATLTLRVDTLTERLDKAREQNNILVARNARLESENEGLRDRYHDLRGVVQVLVGRDQTYRERLGLPPDDIDLSALLRQHVPGPTSGRGTSAEQAS